MKRPDISRRVLAALLAALTLVSFTTLPILAAPGDETASAETAASSEASAPEAEPSAAEASAEETISIATADDLLALAASCTLDSWSRGKRVVLEADLDLTGLDFTPIATFGGTFDGNGHTIRGLSITDAHSPAGLICTLQTSGRVENLSVEATLSPSGQSISVGGLVGENYGTIESCSFTGSVSGTMSVGGLVGENKASGVIRSCRTSGAIDGENRTGGVAGCNLGVIEDCENAAYVNIESVDPGIDLSDLDLSFSLDLSKLSELSTANIATDTGGIAGYNAGTISASRNTAAIGYPHIGYNVGGIAGRTCGQLTGCVNTGTVYGRKDVGGVAGQVEPYIEMQLDDKSSKKLQTQLNELSGLVDQAATDAQGSAGGVSARLNTLSGYVDTAVAEANNIRVNVDGKANVTGGGTANSTTTATPSGGSIDSTSGSLGSVDVKPNEDGSVSIGVSTGDGTITVDPGKVDVDHSGVASGVVDATAGLVAAPDLGGFTSAVNGVSSQIRLLNDTVNGTVGTVSNDVKAINQKFSEISDTLFDAMNDAESGVGSAVTDASAVDVDQITLGKLADCRNEAAVSGDINTGGVAGSMALEYALDPEDDVSSDLDGSYKRQYTYRAVLQRCENTGAVTGKRSYAGGICGRMDLGLITACESYGPVESTSGSYVGGITGLTGATVQTSFAKCTLSGKSYVGGVTGSGIAESLDGSGSEVSGCVTLVSITACDQYGGAISGTTDGTYTENRFVSDSLAGLNQQSVAGSAEPVDFEVLLDEDVLPAAMRTFTLKFVAGDKTLKQCSFSYGDSFDESIFPEIPAEDGSYAAWDRTDLSDLRFDTTVTAVYTEFTPALASDAVREDGRAVFLTEGDYTGAASITASAEAQTPAAFHVRSGSLASRLGGYFDSWQSGTLPPMSTNWEVVDQWSVAIDADSPAPYRVRYLPPEGKTTRLRIYVEQNGVWQTVDYETVGSYLAFDLPSSSARVAAVSTMPVWWIWVAVPLLLALLIFLIIHFLRKAIRKSRLRRAPSAPGANAVSAAPSAAPSPGGLPGDSPEASPGSAGGDPAELRARAELAEHRLAELEAEISELKAHQNHENSNISVESKTIQEEHDICPKAEAAGTAAKPKRRRLFVLLAVLLVALSAVGYFGFSKLKSAVNAYKIIEKYINQDTFQLQADVSLLQNGSVSETSVSVTQTNLDGRPITCLTRDGLTLYLSNDTLYLADGSACALGASGLLDYGALLDMSVSLYRSAELVVSKNGDILIYEASISGDSLDNFSTFFEELIPDLRPELVKASASLTARDGALSALSFTVETSDNSDTVLQLTLTPQPGAVEAPNIPESVLSAMNSGDISTNITMTEDFFRLISVFQAQLGQESFSVDLRLAADCGPVVFDTILALSRQHIDGLTVTAIQKGPLTFYFSDGKLLDSSGNSADIGTNSWASSVDLLDLTAQLLFSATASHTEKPGGQDVYTIALDADGMAAVAKAFSKEIASLDIDFTDGCLEIVLNGNNFASITITCGGTLRLLLTDTAVSLVAVITPVSREITIPQQVLSALQK